MRSGGTGDVIVVGAGVIGCAAALELAKRGVATTVLERAAPGAGASSAAAGILGAQAEAHHDGPEARLCIASRDRYPAWIAELRERTGIDVGYRICGVTQVAGTDRELDSLARGFAWQRRAGMRLEVLDAEALRDAEPSLAPAAGALHFPDDARVDPPLLVSALRVAAERAGATFRCGAHARRVSVVHERVTGVLLEDGTALDAAAVVIAAGSWSSLVEGAGLAPGAVRPARGQMVELTTSPPALRGIVYGPSCYLSPRDDGRVLVGSTLEFVGFSPGVTAGAVRDLLAAALRLAPCLDSAGVGRAWSGFRPHTADAVALIGPTSVDGLVVATGHFRSGILLAPLTADLVAASVLGEPLPPEAAIFDPERAT